MVVVFGGLVDKKFLNDIIVYDIENKLWFEPECTGSVSEGKGGPTPRAFHVAITIDCHMFIFGGRSGGKRLGDFWILDTDIWQWAAVTSFGDLPTPRDFSAAAAIGNQKIVLCGGWDGKKWLSDVYVMDTMSLEWMELSVSGSLPPPRCGHTATMVEKRLLVFGGRVTAQWKRLPISNDEPPPPRAYHTMTSIGARHLLIGGFDGKSTFGDLWWLVPEEFDVDEELEAMGKEMVAYCGGLPLAVKVLGGLLSNKTMVEEWKRVDDNIQSQIVRIDDKSQDSVYRVLSMSYEDLPMQLKHCFLYLAHFPEDYKIQVGKLCNLWEAEGTITSSCDGATTRQIGEEYIDELVRRNMVIGVKEDLSCRWEYCQMHDMMREVCLYKAKEENFLQFIKVHTSSTSNINAHTPTRSRRLVVHGGGSALDMLLCKSNQKARSVLGFGLDSNLWKQSGQGLRNLLLLRVLDLSLEDKSDSRGGRIPSSIGKLIHLRYLSLDMGSATDVPSSLRNLKLLIYLSIYSNERVHLPSIFKEMVELRFLALPPLIDAKTKLELGNLVNLECLTGFRSENVNLEYFRWFRSENGSITDLLRMKKLRILHIKLKGRYTSEILASSLCELRNLEELCLIDENNESDGAYDVDFVWNFIHLRRLAVGIHVTRLPDHSRFPPHLAYISLTFCELEEDPLQILEKLLHLKSVVFKYRSFVGRKMVCSKGGFPQLCKLDIVSLYDLEEWVIEEGSMPCLRTLEIWYCEKLKELPEGLKYITSLKELDIAHKNKEWKTKLVPGGESYHKVQHIPSVQLHYHSDDSDIDE
uniref:Uncharacterized protein n=1 Tax=Brassica campestris TaxID=3711 RepID=M4CM33_BRACM